MSDVLTAADGYGAPPDGFSFEGGNWLDYMQPASWRGLQFGVMDSAVNRGRRTAVHEYPYRDTPWVEDLGRGVRRINFRGFLVGDDVAAQEKAMLDAAELPGSGELVHPTLGSRNVTLTEFSAGQRRELGRVVELDFAFIEGADQLFPTGATSTQDLVNNAAADADTASADDFFRQVGSPVQLGASVVGQVISTTQGFANLAGGIVNDASRAAGAVRGISGIFGANLSLGRYSRGNVIGLPPVVAAAIAGSTSSAGRLRAATGALLSASVTGVTAVRAAGAAMARLASQL